MRTSLTRPAGPLSHANNVRTLVLDSTKDLQTMRARRKMAHRQRRLILDDDGDVVYDEEVENGAQAFCQTRLADCLDTPVDSVAWCIMWGLGRTGRTSTRYWQTQMQGIPFQSNMPDPTPVLTRFYRQHDMEVFGSIRMNDCHDAYGIPHGKLVYPLKVEHPEFLVGDVSEKGQVTSGLKAAMWSGLDYAHPAVREDRFWWIEHAASSYDLDGVDLNFFRMPWIFKTGEEARNMSLMTDLMRRARTRLDDIGAQRGRPVLLGVRVPGTIETCLRIGLDIETWLEEGLVDRLLTGGGYAPFSTPAEELISLGHRHDVLVYPCINCGAIGIGSWAEALRGAAANLWHAGADGLYLWNFHYIKAPSRSYGRPFPEAYQRLLEIGDPKKMAYEKKIFAVDATQPILEQYRRASAPCPLPLELGAEAGSGPYRIPIRIGDDIPAVVRRGISCEVMLRLQVAGGVDDDQLRIAFNSTDAELATITDDEPRLEGSGQSRQDNDGEGSRWMELPIRPGAAKLGSNEFQISIAQRGSGARNNLTLKQVWVVVQYQTCPR